jgi:hypothetical protein
MKRGWLWGAGLGALLTITGVAWGQAPGLPGGAGAGAGGGVGLGSTVSTQAGTTAAAGAQPHNIFSFLCPTEEQCARVRRCICESQLGQLLNSSLAPVSAFTGGIIPQFCPPPPGTPGAKPSAEDQAKGGAEGAAAKIQAEEANAKARRAAVRYLGTVDCHWFPEAAKALQDSLRTDKNECVRWEAAMALSTGCCCSKDTIKVLTICVNGGESDGNPAENSPRVKAAALLALEHCLARYCEPVKEEKKKAPDTPPPPPPPVRPERPEVPPADPDNIAAAEPTRDQLVADARTAIARAKWGQAGTVTLPTGERSVLGAVGRAVDYRNEPRNVQVAADGRLAPAGNQILPTGKRGLFEIMAFAREGTEAPAAAPQTPAAAPAMRAGPETMVAQAAPVNPRAFQPVAQPTPMMPAAQPAAALAPGQDAEVLRRNLYAIGMLQNSPNPAERELGAMLLRQLTAQADPGQLRMAVAQAAPPPAPLPPAPAPVQNWPQHQAQGPVLQPPPPVPTQPAPPPMMPPALAPPAVAMQPPAPTGPAPAFAPFQAVPTGEPAQTQAVAPAPPQPVIQAVAPPAPPTPQEAQAQYQRTMYLVSVLRAAPVAAEREMAAIRLAEADGVSLNAAVDALTQAVRRDPAAPVRVAAIQALAHLRAPSPHVKATLDEALRDADARVRDEASLARTRLGVVLR